MPKTLKLISLGARGVGKTVFLVNSCSDSLRNNTSNDQELFFECSDQQSKDMVRKLLGYIEQNQAYPPATFKISNFNLSLKRKINGKQQTVCNLRWSDIPGEWCDLDNPNFQTALLESHGCCIFIDADAVLHQASYIQILSQSIKQVEAINTLINQANSATYPISIIFTKYDLIQSNPIGLIQLQEKLKPLLDKIESNEGISKRFYSGIPLVKGAGGLHQTKNAENALMWMTSTLNSIHTTNNPPSLGQVLDNITQPSASSQSGKSNTSRASSGQAKQSQKLLPLVLLICGALAAVSGIVLAVLPRIEGKNPSTAQNIRAFETVLKEDPGNENAIAGLLKIYSEDLQQNDKAISLLESLHSRSPEDLNILVPLAQLYEVQKNTSKQEETLDKILALDNINLTAIYSKVRLKVATGQPNEARDVINQAQQHVTTPAFQEILQQLSKEIPPE